MLFKGSPIKIFFMKTVKQIILESMAFLFTLLPLSAAESVQNLLAGYMKNDLSVQKESGNMQKVLLESRKSQISEGFSFKIQTGTIEVTTGADGGVKFRPSAEFSLPQAANLGIEVSSDITISYAPETDVLSKISLALSADIISNNSKKRRLSQLKTEREILEEKRVLQNTFVNAEKEFYTSLRKLYSLVSEVIAAEKDLYEDQLTFEQVKAQGYRTSSTKYRRTQMEVLSDNHTVESKKRELGREIRIFAAKCGIYEFSYENAEDFLPLDIPLVEPVSIRSFGKETYKDIESAKWAQYINGLEREADGAISLRGSAGYTFNTSSTGSDSVDVGAKFAWHDTGLVVSAGTSLPVRTDQFNPSYTLGISFDPNAFRTAAVDKEISKIEIEQEELAVTSAERNFFTAVIAQRSELADLQWERKTNEESLDMYTSLEADMKNYLSQGLITESEYRSAQVNKENYRIKCILNSIDMIVYNAETKMLFVRGGELDPEKRNEGQEAESDLVEKDSSEENANEE